MKVKKIHHFGIRVSNLNESISIWREIFGLSLDRIEEVPSYNVRVAFLPIDDGYLELVGQINKETDQTQPDMQNSEGLDHLCLEVENLDEVLQELREKGVRLLDDTPQIHPGRKLAFVHPEASGGVLLEFYQLTGK